MSSFRLRDEGAIAYFETDLNARRLRSEVVASTGGNVGAVEIEVYGTPVR